MKRLTYAASSSSLSFLESLLQPYWNTVRNYLQDMPETNWFLLRQKPPPAQKLACSQVFCNNPSQVITLNMQCLPTPKMSLLSVSQYTLVSKSLVYSENCQPGTSISLIVFSTLGETSGSSANSCLGVRIDLNQQQAERCMSQVHPIRVTNAKNMSFFLWQPDQYLTAGPSSSALRYSLWLCFLLILSSSLRML